MKNTWAKYLSIVAVIGFALTSCNDGNDTTHTHTFGEWAETTPATIVNELVEIDGVETGTCSVCGDSSTRPVAFRTYFYGTWSFTNNTNVTMTVVIDENNFKLDDTDGDHQYFSINSWSPEKNTHSGTMAEYHVGYRLNGITMSNQWWPTVDVIRIYLNKNNGQSIAITNRLNNDTSTEPVIYDMEFSSPKNKKSGILRVRR